METEEACRRKDEAAGPAEIRGNHFGLSWVIPAGSELGFDRSVVL